MENKEKAIARLYEVLAGISDARECAAFLEDLCTHKEIEQMAQRVRYGDGGYRRVLKKDGNE